MCCQEATKVQIQSMCSTTIPKSYFVQCLLALETNILMHEAVLFELSISLLALPVHSIKESRVIMALHPLFIREVLQKLASLARAFDQ